MIFVANKPLKAHNKFRLGENGNMKANRKFIDGEEAVSAVIGVILMVAITVAIAATVYVYVTGMIQTGTTETENASVTAKSENDLIRVTLASGGQRYDATTGYSITNDVDIFIDGEKATLSSTAWEVGQGIVLGWSGAQGTAPAREGSGTTFAAGDYAVTVSILDTVVFDSSVRVT